MNSCKINNEGNKVCKLTNTIKDKVGMRIDKDTEIIITKTLTNPNTKLKEHIISIDNGTGIIKYFPKTIITDRELIKGTKEFKNSFQGMSLKQDETENIINEMISNSEKNIREEDEKYEDGGY